MNNLSLKVALSAIDNLTAPLRNVQKQAQKLSSALGENKKSLRNLENQQEKNSKELQKYAKALNPLNAKLKQTTESLSKERTELKRMHTAFKNAKNPTKQFADRIKQTEQSVKKLKIEQAKEIAKIREVRAEFKKSGFSAKEYASNQLKLKRDIAKTNAEIDKQKQKMSQLNQLKANNHRYKNRVDKLKKGSDRLQNFGQKNAMIATAGGFAGMQILSPAVEFEHSFSKVIALTRLNKTKAKDLKEIKALEQQAIDLGASTAFTSAEVANAQGYLAMAGFTPEKIRKALPSILNTSLASDVDIAEVSDIASDIAGGFKIPASEMGRVADVLTMTFTTSNTSLLLLKETMSEASPVMTSLGQSIESTSAMAGLLGNVGIKGSKAGTTLKNIGLNMIDNKHLEKLGVQVKDTAGNMRQLPEILAEIKQKTDKLGTAERSAVIKKIFGKIPVAGALELISQADGALQNYEKTLKNVKGTAEQVSKTMTDDLTGDVKSLFSAKDSISIKAYKALGGSLREITQDATKMLRSFGNWIEKNPKLTKQILFLGGGLIALTGTVGALSMILSFSLYPMARFALFLGHTTGATAMLSKCFGVLKTDLSKTTGVFSKSGKIMQFALRGLMSPLRLIPLLISPIGALFVIIGLLIYKYWEPIKAFFIGFWQGLTEALSPVLERFQPLGELLGWISEKIKACWDWFTQLIAPVSDVTGKFEGATSAGKAFGKAIGNAINLITKPLQWLMDGLGWVSDKINGVSEDSKKLQNANKNVTEKAQNQQKKVNKITKHTRKYDTATQQARYQYGFYKGGFVGSGGKYEPKGIVHGGEYVMTAEATKRLGVANLNKLNYGKATALATLASSVALAQPMNVKVDNRPLLSASKPQAQAVAPVNQNINITINAGPGQSEQEIARIVMRKLEEAKRQAQAKARSSYFDR
ncbi:phage tail tape measure protein [Pasteurella skyensis]|uniref:Phage tail tape measure protein n=1 Tax=Phocoenobacter skyensis TaxID=97481 RepID=A0AAJ6NAB4_9PAST|nr:phage tail tape measure protein [Pasteurella skyensis]MDP8173128.1 phage tail tape measure protein [Pasteurella skyensis]MDP8178939.1 phage tail tape measure protein [Pasteurella skyensis]